MKRERVIYPYVNGFAAVEDNGRWYHIDESGRRCYKRSFDGASSILQQGYASVYTRAKGYQFIWPDGTRVAPSFLCGRF